MTRKSQTSLSAQLKASAKPAQPPEKHDSFAVTVADMIRTAADKRHVAASELLEKIYERVGLRLG